VAISERTRKVLWVKAGGRCSVCRVQVATEGTDADDPSVFGEEAHIVGRSPGGPRAGSYVGNLDGYDNLILLCSKDHKRVDDQVNTYTVDKLREIKRDHEIWAAKLGEPTDFGPVRVVPDPTKPTPKILKLFTTGSSFWHFFEGADAFYPSWPDGLNDEHEDLIAAFLDDLRDWMDVTGIGADYRTSREASKAVSEHIKTLGEAGFLVGMRRRHCLLTGGVKDPTSWEVVDIEIQPASIAQVVDEDGQPFKLGEGA
jgi:hypothetical protein